jgi:DNA modification methylase
MPKFNDIDPNAFKDDSVWTDSLWIINERDNTGKHSNFYHGNFVPQIVTQLLTRYTKKGDVVFDPFIGGGTTAVECEKMGRNCIGLDIQPKLVDYVNQIQPVNTFNECIVGNAVSGKTYDDVRSILLRQIKNGGKFDRCY